MALDTKKALKNLEIQFVEYVKGERKKFDLTKIGVHTDLRELAGTPLQKSVWRELLNIPYGKIISYEELAQRIGKSSAVRAVASAVGKNPLCVVIPCHRVLPKNSVYRLSKHVHTKRGVPVGGYVLGTPLKETLLELEGII